jgi:CDP-glucose 4,6-dehydratase
MSQERGFADRSVLVTGAQGFIGSWLVERLLENGARVVVPGRAAAERSRFREIGAGERCEIVPLDLLELTSLVRAMDEHQVDAVFHLAAHTVVDQGNTSPLRTFQTNVRGTYNLLEACRIGRAHGAERRVVIASSARVYGNQGQLPHSETVHLRPVGPYDVSKACVDMIARSYAVTHDLPVAVTRMSNVYGGGDLNLSRLVPATARALVRGEAPVLRSDGSPERNYMYVEDAVDAYLAVEDSLRACELWGRAWNAGGDQPIAAIEIVRGLIDAAGAGVEPQLERRRQPESAVDRRVLDSTEIRATLGWAPRWDLDDALRKTYAWYAQSQPRVF